MPRRHQDSGESVDEASHARTQPSSRRPRPERALAKEGLTRAAGAPAQAADILGGAEPTSGSPALLGPDHGERAIRASPPSRRTPPPRSRPRLAANTDHQRQETQASWPERQQRSSGEHAERAVRPAVPIAIALVGAQCPRGIRTRRQSAHGDPDPISAYSMPQCGTPRPSPPGAPTGVHRAFLRPVAESSPTRPQGRR